MVKFEFLLPKQLKNKRNKTRSKSEIIIKSLFELIQFDVE